MQYGAGNAGPHAVTSINHGATFDYDANDNMLQGKERTIAWTSADQPYLLTKNN
ncbi:MAG: hypothetical protein V7784_18645 [Oceanospirillaceae bacterium]